MFTPWFKVVTGLVSVTLSAMKQIVLMMAVVALVGCGTINDSEIRRFVSQNNINLQNLEIGMTKTEVRKVMSQGKTPEKFPFYAKGDMHRIQGAPSKTEAYATANGGMMEFWMYYTVPGQESVGPRDINYTPVCFVDGKVTGWGRNFYDDTIKIRKEIIRKP